MGKQDTGAGMVGMAKPLQVAVLLCLAAIAISGISPAIPDGPAKAPPVNERIKKVVVLMMENRSFDHYFGYSDMKVDKLSGTETNCKTPDNKKSPCFTVTPKQGDHAVDDPPHDLDAITTQIYGYGKPWDKKDTPKMNGFAAAAEHEKRDMQNVMNSLTPESGSGQILNLLASEYAVADAWFCSIPGPTDPNRAFSMSGTSQGVTTNFNGTLWTQQSYFDFLRANNRTVSAVYQDDLWAIGYFADMHKVENTPNIMHLDEWFKDLAAGTLADFTWLQPRMTNAKGEPTWQHPTASIREGERLLRDIYLALRASKFWEELAFVITYDEHGGFYDHVVPPQDGIPAPDDNRDSTHFAFDRLGVRIPTVIVSPWIDAGTVIHDPYPNAPAPTSKFEGTSVISTASRLLGLQAEIDAGKLGARAPWAATFEQVFMLRDTVRTDAPATLPEVPKSEGLRLAVLQQSKPDDSFQSQLLFYCLYGAPPRRYEHDMDQCYSKKHLEDDFPTQLEASKWINDESERLMNHHRGVARLARLQAQS